MKKKIFSGVLIIILVFAVIVGIVWHTESHYDADSVDDADGSQDGIQKIYYDGEWYCPRNDVSTLLIIGVDKFEEYASGESEGITNSQQCDFLGLLVIDESEESYKVIQINRDTMTEVPVLGVEGYAAGTKNEQIALAHTYGSGGDDSYENTAEAVSSLLFGVKISHYLGFVMDAVSVITDDVGGVSVMIEDDFGDSSPDFIKGQNITLTGEQAIRFVRARMEMEDDPTNIARMERQSTYLTELKSQIDTKCQEDSDFILSLLGDVGPYMTSDLSVGQISEIYSSVKGYTFEGFIVPEGESSTDTEFAEFYVDDVALKELVINTFYKLC